MNRGLGLVFGGGAIGSRDAPIHVTTDENGEHRTGGTLAATGPWKAKAIDLVSFGSGVAMGVTRLYDTVMAGGASAAGLAATAALPVATYYGLKFGLRQVLQHRVAFEFTTTGFRYRTLLGWKEIDRRLPHRFLLVDHYRGQRERQRLEHFERKYHKYWWSWSRRRYFGESYHLVLECQGRRFYIMAIHLHKNATAMLSKLQASEEAIEAKGRTGRGVAQEAGDAWSRQPGGELT